MKENTGIEPKNRTKRKRTHLLIQEGGEIGGAPRSPLKKGGTGEVANNIVPKVTPPAPPFFKRRF